MAYNISFEQAVETMIEKSLGENGESCLEMETAQAIVNGIIELKEEVLNAKNS